MEVNGLKSSGLGPRMQGPLLICVEGTSDLLKGSPFICAASTEEAWLYSQCVLPSADLCLAGLLGENLTPP